MNLPRLLKHPLPVYLVASFVAFYRCLVGGQAYFANDLLAQFGPWRTFLRDQLLSGHFPLWNPYIFSGQPFFADLQMHMLYPLNYLTIFFPVATGLSLFFFLHMALAGWGMHRWMKSLRLPDVACFVGGLAFAWSLFFWWELIHPPVHAAYAWMPWLFESLERLSQKSTLRRAFLSGLVWSQLFLAGSFQISLVAYAALVYFLFRLGQRLAPAWKEAGGVGCLRSRARPALLAGLLFGLGSLPLVFMLVPVEEFSRLSVRRMPDLTYDNFNAQFSMQPSTVGQFIFPTYSLPKDQTIEVAIQTLREGGDCDYMANFAYLGIWAPLLMLAAFRRRDRLPWLLALLALVSVMVAFGKYFFLHRLFCAAVPGFSLIRVPFRFIYLYSFCGTALLALGYAALETSRTEGDKDRFPLVAWSYTAVLLLVALSRPSNTGREILGLLLGATGWFLMTQTPSLLGLGKWLFRAGVLLPILLMGWGSFSVGPASNFDFKDRVTRSFRQVLDETAPFRVFVNEDVPYYLETRGRLYPTNLPYNLSAALPYRTIRGYNPLRLKDTNDMDGLPFPTLLYLSGTRSLLTTRDAGELKGFTRRQVGELFVYQILPTPSYVTAPIDLRLAPDAPTRLAVLKDPGFPVYETALLNEPLPEEVAARLTGKKGEVAYNLQVDETDRQVFGVRLSLPSFLVFSEVNYPGWKASVDGRPAPLYTANHIYRGVFVPEGQHLVEFRFEPWWRKFIVPGLTVWLFISLGFWFYVGRKKRSDTEPVSPNIPAEQKASQI